MLAKVYDRYQHLDDPVANENARLDFVFHMTDWLMDLEDIAKIYKNPENCSPKEAGRIVYGFLIHAVPHLIAAARLIGEFHDTFADMEKESCPVTPVSPQPYPPVSPSPPSAPAATRYPTECSPPGPRS